MDAPLLAFTLATIRLATPLLIAALGELAAERSGVLNIGIEGMMLGGAFAAFAVGVGTGSAWAGLLAAALAGAALAALFASFVLWRRADPIVCGAALNLLALGATGSAYRLLFPADAPLEGAPALPDFVFPGLALALLVATALVLSRTRFGLGLRAAGESAEAAHAQGVAVLRIRWQASIAGGACAGLAGAGLVLWLADSFVEGMTSGRGFIALALVLFGGYRPLRIAGGALLFGAASALQFRLQAAGAQIPYSLLLMTPYLLTLIVLALFAGRARPPADLAKPFRRTQ